MSSKILIVYRKELLEVLRDKRTLFTTLLLPVILYPVLMIGFNAIMTRQTGVLEERGGTVAIQDSVQNEISMRIASELSQIENVTVIPAANNVQSLYLSKDIQSIVTIKDSVDVSGLRKYHTYIQYDAANESSNHIYGKVSDQIKATEHALIEEQLSNRGVSPELMNLVDVRKRDTADSQKKMGMLLGMFLPYIMIIMLLAGASIVAADLVAGEKERKTLETLLVSGVGRREVVIGKYLTIITLSMLNLIINLFSISFSMRYMLSRSGLDMAGAQMPIKAILILLAAMLPLATLYAAVLLSISTFSRNMKEARTYEQPLMMVSMILAMISFLPAIEMSNLMAIIPVINISLLFKAVMINDYQVSHLLITIISTLVLDVLAIWGTIKLFNTEGILFRSDDDSGSLKGIKKNKANFFNPYNGLVYYTIALLLLYYLGSYLQQQDLARGLVLTQLLIIAMPVLLIIRALKLDGNKILRLKAPQLKELLIIPFIAIPAAIIVSLLSQVINTIYPFPENYLKMLGGLFKMDLPLWGSFLVIAVAPGICEELMFRGFLIRFFEKYGIRASIILSGLFFAAFHLDPFRFIPVLILGIILAYLTLRSGSIFNAMFSHAINNGFALIIMTLATKPFMKFFVSGEDSLHYWLAIPAVIILAWALYMFHKVTGGKQCVE
ncbi:MAG: ABC transporter permease subunit/CPBP intramembrane protease [Candidatus Cloacimonadaceae bacterium]|jgi:sodium transport system permease protein|nr:ABC transporter permease subunit/CPBP intramembrane protease [Candidatus Cloacimonadaceae bacterium]